MTASAILSVPGVAAVSAASAPSEGAVGDGGAFGALLQQQAQSQGNPQVSTQAQPLPAEMPPLDGGEGGSTLPVGAMLPEIDPAQVRDATADPARPALSSEVAGKLLAGDASSAVEGETFPAIDVAVRSEAEIPELVPEEPPVEAVDGEAPPADDTLADAPVESAMPLVLAHQQPPAQSANLAVAIAPSLAGSPTVEADPNEVATGEEPDVVETRGHDRRHTLSAKAQEPANDEGVLGALPQQTSVAGNATAVDAAFPSDSGDKGLSSPLLTQTLPAISAKPAGSPYPPTAQTVSHQPIVKAEPGAIGGNVGMEIAKVAKAGRDDLLIRLDPREMGRVDVRLSFDSDGVLRAVLSADSPAALDMLRRESGDLNRALADAGVRADGQSLRFDTRSGGQGAGSGEGWQRGQQEHGASQSRGLADDGALDLPDPIYRSLNASGHVDLMA